MENIYDNYIYLKELDSVHMADENNVAEKILFDTLVFSEKSVVLTYNQIADSEVFLNILHESDIYAALLDFFKEKKLLVNRFKKDMNLSYYIQKNFRENTTFISTYFSFLNIYSEDKINIIYKGMNESFKYGDSLYLKNVMPDDISDVHQKQLINYINFMLTVNLYMNDYECYILPKDDSELIGHRMDDYLNKILLNLRQKESSYTIPLELLIEKHGSNPVTRSVYLNTLDLYIDKEYHKMITEFIHLAYNYTLGYSVSNSFSDNDLDNDINRLLNNHVYNLRSKFCRWKDGYRVVSITTKLRRMIKNCSWNSLLKISPFIELFKLISSIIIAIVTGTLFMIIGSVGFIWESLTFSTIITLFYNKLMSVGESKLESIFPDWIYSGNLFEQISYFINDFILVYMGGNRDGFK